MEHSYCFNGLDFILGLNICPQKHISEISLKINGKVSFKTNIFCAHCFEEHEENNTAIILCGNMRDTSSEISNTMNCSSHSGIRSNYFTKKKKSVFFSGKYGFMCYICSIQKHNSKSCIMGNI